MSLRRARSTGRRWAGRQRLRRPQPVLQLACRWRTTAERRADRPWRSRSSTSSRSASGRAAATPGADARGALFARAWRARPRARRHGARAVRLYGSLGATGKGPRQRQGGAARPGRPRARTRWTWTPCRDAGAMRQRALRAWPATTPRRLRREADLVFPPPRDPALPRQRPALQAFDAAGRSLGAHLLLGGRRLRRQRRGGADGSRQKAIAPDATVLPHPSTSGAELLLALTARAAASPSDAPQRAPLAQRRRDRRRPAA